MTAISPGARGLRAAAAAVALAALPAVASAQLFETTVQEFWPGLDVYYKLGEQSRIYAFASFARARETATSTEFTWGVNYDWFAAELPVRVRAAVPQMEQYWSHWYRVGYVRVNALDGGRNENRLLGEATLRSEPLFWDVQLANRSRLELRDIDGEFSWRYRNRSRVERTFGIVEGLGHTVGGPLLRLGATYLVPYAMLEFYWDSRDSDWTRRYRQFGVEMDLPRNQGIELYLAIQDDKRKEASTVIAWGVTYTLRF
jgi:hypothetical protein